MLCSQYDYNLCWHRTGGVLVPAGSRISGKAGFCNSSQSKQSEPGSSAGGCPYHLPTVFSNNIWE